MLPYLVADLSWDAGKLWVGSKCCQVFYGLDQRGSGDSALVSVLLWEITIQSLDGERKLESYKTRTPLCFGHVCTKTWIRSEEIFRIHSVEESSKHSKRQITVGCQVRAEASLAKEPYLYSFNQIGRAVGHLLGRLHKVPLCYWVCCLGWSQAASVAQCRCVLSNNRGCRQNLSDRKDIVINEWLILS